MESKGPLVAVWSPKLVGLSLVFSVSDARKLLIFFAWGARGPGFKSPRPDQTPQRLTALQLSPNSKTGSKLGPNPRPETEARSAPTRGGRGPAGAGSGLRREGAGAAGRRGIEPRSTQCSSQSRAQSRSLTRANHSATNQTPSGLLQQQEWLFSSPLT